MSELKKSKINQLLNNWPRGTVYASSWLHKQGFGYNLLHHYKKSNWVFTVGDNAIARVGDKISWEGGLYTLQKQLGLGIHVGGKTTLEMSGQAHYLRLGQEHVSLYGKPGTTLPTWFKKYDWKAKIQFITTNLFSSKNNLGLQKKELGEFSITMSSVERALFELLYLIPQEQSFEEASELMEGQMTLRPKLIQSLLEDCHSIKAKRLFMYFAEGYNLPWVKKLDLSKINFGKGKRMIVKGSPLDSKYQITVPKLN